MTNGSFLLYIWPALSNNWSWKPNFGLFESGRFTQVLLYVLLLKVPFWNLKWNYTSTLQTAFIRSARIIQRRFTEVLLLWNIYVISVLFCCAFMHVCLLLTGEGLTSCLSFVMSICDVVTFQLVSWVGCGVWLYLFLIFALFLTLISGVKRRLT